MDASDLLAGSPKVKSVDFLNESYADGLNGRAEEGNGTGATAFGAKGNNLWLSDEDSDW